jgi:hypothetical protein
VKDLNAFLSAAPYTVNLELIVTDDTSTLCLGGEAPQFEEADGLTVFLDGDFWIVLRRPAISHTIIAHECFHATHFILDSCDVKFTKGAKNEAFSYFNGYLHKQVYSQLKKWHIRVK